MDLSPSASKAAAAQGHSGSRDEPRPTLALAGGKLVEFGERGGQLSCCGAEGPRRGAHLAERGDRQYPARSQAIDDRPIEPRVPELVAEDDVDGRPGR